MGPAFYFIEMVDLSRHEKAYDPASTLDEVVLQGTVALEEISPFCCDTIGGVVIAVLDD